MYTAPPGADESNDDREAERERADPSPELDNTGSTTDANWTGNVAADD